MKSLKNKPGMLIYQIKVTLAGSKPPIWRRLLVGSDITLADLHHVIQLAFGWWDAHPHQFIVGDTHYGVPHPDYSVHSVVHDEQDVTLGQIATGERFRFRYEYDFGDSWLHQVLVEKVLPPGSGRSYPLCLKGRRACPPEDVGGIRGYYHFLQAIADPRHREHKTTLEWAGGRFDAEAFDLQEVNQALDRFRHRLTRQQVSIGSVHKEGGTLALIDRGVAIIRPKQPLVDWVNRTVPLSTPLTQDELKHNCTAILVPELDSLEAVLEYLQPLKPLLFQMELEDWNRNPSDWPEECTGELFDAWFDIEAHSMVWELAGE